MVYSTMLYDVWINGTSQFIFIGAFMEVGEQSLWVEEQSLQESSLQAIVVGRESMVDIFCTHCKHTWSPEEDFAIPPCLEFETMGSFTR